MIPQVALVLHHPDQLPLLVRALDNAHHFHQVAAGDAEHRAKVLAQAGHAPSARSWEARAAELARRRDLLQQLRAQLPTTDDTAPLPAPRT